MTEQPSASNGPPVESWDTKMVVGWLGALTNPQFHGGEFAWRGIVQYRAAARLQVERITHSLAVLEEARASSWPDMPEPDVIESLGEAERLALITQQFARSDELQRLHEAVLTEIHFYFICWHQIARRVAVLANELDIPALKRFAKSHHAFRLKNPKYHKATDQQLLGRYAHGRNQFEHLDAMLPGQENDDRITFPMTPDGPPGRTGTGIAHAGGRFWLGFPEFWEGTFRIGERTWDVTAASMERLDAIIGELETILRDALPGHFAAGWPTPDDS